MTDEYNCQYCSKLCKNLNSLRNHERLCSKNPNKDISYLSKYCESHTVWNKGLTKETSESVRKYSIKLTADHSDIQDIDDDGKLIQRWFNKRVNARAEGVECLLTLEEYCQKVREAGLKSSDLGFTGKKYVLARIGDTGDYTVDNCRFITQKENAREKRLSPKEQACRKEFVRKGREALAKLSKEELSLRISRGVLASNYNKRLHKKDQ